MGVGAIQVAGFFGGLVNGRSEMKAGRGNLDGSDEGVDKAGYRGSESVVGGAGRGRDPVERENRERPCRSSNSFPGRRRRRLCCSGSGSDNY